MLTSIIIPTLGRSKKLISSLQALKRTTEGHEIEVIVIVDEPDKDSQVALEDNRTLWNYSFVRKGHPTPVEKWNHGAENSHGDWLCLGADDVLWQPAWLELSLNHTNHRNFIALPDRKDANRPFEPHYMATRSWLKKFNGGVLAIPHYRHWGFDVETAMRAHRTNTYVISNAVLPHPHPSFGTEASDSTYERAQVYYEKDIALFEERRLKGFKDDFQGYI